MAEFPAQAYEGAVRRILDLQRRDGAIPWFDRGVFDPWNHLHAAMGLNLAGERDAVRRAFRHLQETQLADGSWWGQYGGAAALDEGRYQGEGRETRIRDTNFSAYIATAAWHDYLLRGDRACLKDLWPHIDAAIAFVLSLQYEEGDIRWAARDAHTPQEDALVAGSSSIYKSLDCAIAIAGRLGERRPAWSAARARLGIALREKPHRFDRQWGSKAHFAMDWYYPVLCGVVRGGAARARLAARWPHFVMEGLGCRCVADQPWITVAETAELVVALAACGQRDRGRALLSALARCRDADGAYWMGYQAQARRPWPAEKPGWTAAAVMLAHDAVERITPASALF